jgi:hypothetical protein
MTSPPFTWYATLSFTIWASRLRWSMAKYGVAGSTQCCCMVRVSRSQLYVFSDLRNEFRSSCSEILHDQRCICEGFFHALSYGNPETCGEHHHPQDPQVDQLGTREPCLPDSLFVVSSKCANLSGWYLPRAPTQLSMQRQEPRATPSASTVGPSPTQHHKNWSCQKYKHTFSTSVQIEYALCMSTIDALDAPAWEGALLAQIAVGSFDLEFEPHPTKSIRAKTKNQKWMVFSIPWFVVLSWPPTTCCHSSTATHWICISIGIFQECCLVGTGFGLKAKDRVVILLLPTPFSAIRAAWNPDKFVIYKINQNHTKPYKTHILSDCHWLKLGRMWNIIDGITGYITDPALHVSPKSETPEHNNKGTLQNEAAANRSQSWFTMLLRQLLIRASSEGEFNSSKSTGKGEQKWITYDARK